MASGPGTRTKAGMPSARAASSAISVAVRSNGLCSWSITTKSKPTSPIISVAWLDGVLRNVPIRGSRAAIRWRKDKADELMMNHPMLKCAVSRHRIIVSVQNPSRLLREVDARRAKYVNELVGAATDGFGCMNRRRRDDRDRWATAQ